MSPLISLLSRHAKRAVRRKPTSTNRPVRRLSLEALEDRTTPTVSLSIADATLTEIGSPSAFITPGSGGLDAPHGIALGPDGHLYVAGNGGAVRRYNAATGAYIGTFVAQGSGGLSDVFGLAFGPDGHLYVGSGATDQVLRYNGTTGAFMNAFVAAGSGGLDYPRGLTFGPDGNLYVGSFFTHSILRYQGPSGGSPGSPLPAAGQSGATFVPSDSGGLFQPQLLIFGPDGHLYANGRGMMNITRYDGATGAFLNIFVPDSLGGLVSGRGMAFDQEGRLYVGDLHNAVHRYDAQGNSLGDLLVDSVPATLSVPFGLIFDAQGSLLISCRDSDMVVKYDRGVVVSLSAASPTPVTVDFTTADGTAGATDYHALSGTVTFQPGQTTRRVLLATRDDLDNDPNETFAVQLGNPTGGATIGDGTGVVTVGDEDGSRQLTVADTSAIEGDPAAHFRGNFMTGIPATFITGIGTPPGGSGNGFHAIVFGPDGNIYTHIRPNLAIDRYDGTTGAFMDRFASGGPLRAARDMAFRAGYLYVGCEDTNGVLRYDATTGAFVDVFVTAGSDGLDGPHGMTFGPDANNDGVPELYASSGNRVIRFDGATGAPLGTYVTPGSGGLSFSLGITFDPSGSFLYVTNPFADQVLKYNALTGAYVGVGASGIDYPNGVTFGPDGLLYVSGELSSRIMRFTAGGTYVDDYVSAGAGGLSRPGRMTFGTDGDLYVASSGTSSIMRFGTANEAVFTVSISTPSTLPVTVNYSTADGTALVGSDYTATTGTVTIAPGFTTATIRVPLLNDSVGESAKTFHVNLSGAAGAVITDNQGVGIITDDDATKFFVVNDAGTDHTYRYGAPGNGLGDSALVSGNTAPRGAASNAAGTTVWVADANKNVYVYSNTGVQLGSWTAGGLNPSAQVEGLATNGTDVWIVDAKQDKVFKYTNAASRLSGSQNAASSFSLNSGNKNPKGVVTDGASLWVVDDAATDKVFKYTLTGALLGSWTIDAANASPTGITLDPSAPAHLWVVDNGTDRVYQYDNAVGRTSGSQAAGASFALVAGNTNPQGIADPPAPSLETRPLGGLTRRLPDGSRPRPGLTWNDLARDANLNAVAWGTSRGDGWIRRAEEEDPGHGDGLPNRGEEFPTAGIAHSHAADAGTEDAARRDQVFTGDPFLSGLGLLEEADLIEALLLPERTAARGRTRPF